MTLATVRRLAADIFNIGQNKVWIDPDGIKEAEGALTRSDVKGLIEKGIVKKTKLDGRASTGRIGRTGHGRRRGTPVSSKTVWMMKIRAQRGFLKSILEDGALKKESKRVVYRKIKSGIFRNKRALLLYLKENKLVAGDYEPKKREYTPKPQKAAKVKVLRVKSQEASKPAMAAKSAPIKPATSAGSVATSAIQQKHEKGEQK